MKSVLTRVTVQVERLCCAVPLEHSQALLAGLHRRPVPRAPAPRGSVIGGANGGTKIWVSGARTAQRARRPLRGYGRGLRRMACWKIAHRVR
jgi:hypothetical protein